MRDYRAVNKQVEKVPGDMSNPEAEMGDLQGVMLGGMSLEAEAQEVFTIATPEVWLPPRVCPKVSHATACFQGVVTELLAGLNCMVWVDDIMCWEADEDDLLNTLDKIIGRF